jgi:hypothetical protein
MNRIVNEKKNKVKTYVYYIMNLKYFVHVYNNAMLK